jgi:hypothetical protein
MTKVVIAHRNGGQLGNRPVIFQSCISFTWFNDDVPLGLLLIYPWSQLDLGPHFPHLFFYGRVKVGAKMPDKLVFVPYILAG